MTKIFAVVGKPIAHSLSPAMHNAAFEALGIDAVYTRMAAKDAKDAMRTAQEIGISGLSVTAPFKLEFLKMASDAAKEAKAIGAANTVVFAGKKIKVFNSDVKGVADALKQHGVTIRGKHALVIGAGGAAKAAVYALRGEGAHATVANRTLQKAKALAKKFNVKACALAGKEFEKAVSDASIIVSTASTGERIIAPGMLRRGMAVLDSVYAKKTAVALDAKKKGCKVVDGREWLLYQGVRAFEIFTGRKAPASIMRKAIDNAGSASMKKRNIALIGFMGSGKTTLAKEIATLSGMQAVEIDKRIEKKAGMKIGKIFEKFGEGEFRGLERQEIAKVAKMKNSVISCGGGAVLDSRNADILKTKCVVVWLWASPAEIIRRLKGDSSRPLMGRKDRLAAAKEIISRRLAIYAKSADFVIGTQGKTPEGIAKLVLDEAKIAMAKRNGKKLA